MKLVNSPLQVINKLELESERLDIKSIVERCERIVHGKKCLYVPMENASGEPQLVVVMSAHNQGNRYLGLRSFLEDQRCDLLFVADPANSWYLDEDSGESFQALFKEMASPYRPENVSFFGSSMSGYGALYHAVKANANAILSNPQVNIDISIDYSWPELRLHLGALKQRINLEEWIPDHIKDTAIYIVHGHNTLDTLNVKKLLSSKLSDRRIIVQTVDIDSHKSVFGRKVQYIYAAHEMLRLFRKNLAVSAEDLSEDDQFYKVHQVTFQKRRALNRHVYDPLLDSDEETEVLWHNRRQYERPGAVIRFSNCGLYRADGTLTGALCWFDGQEWRLIDPIPDADDNLLVNANFEKISKGRGPFSENAAHFADGWWMRVGDHLDHIVTPSEDSRGLQIEVQSKGGRNAFINQSIRVGSHRRDLIAGRYVTLSADVKVSDGFVYLCTGGYDSEGFHHRNETTQRVGEWERVTVVERMSDTLEHDHEHSLFARVSALPDGKAKQVSVRRLMLVPGYFPMGIPFRR